MKKQNGLTLIELMITTIILVILASAAVPSMKGLFDRSNRDIAGPAFEKTVKLARSEAIQRSQTVRISPTSGSNDWSQGWRIDLIVSSDPIVLQLIRSFDPLPGTTVFTSDTFDGNTPLDVLPNGQASLVGNFTLSQAGCSAGDINTYSVLLSGTLNRRVTPCP
ncbi:GspH/FimT family pseudopilin [Pseudomonas sp. HK3]